MLSDVTSAFNKDDLDRYLMALARLFRKQNGRGASAEIILVGGAAILVNYRFRDMTMDIDAAIHASSSIRDAINQIGDRYKLPRGWLNTDFMRTTSYTDKLNAFSQYYKTFSNVLQVRTVSAEYLIAMKLKSGRKYKSDLSDIIGILAEHEKCGQPITWERIESAMHQLYQGWEGVADETLRFIRDVFKTGNYAELFKQLQQQEKRAKDVLIAFQRQYPDAVTESNVDAILKQLQSDKPSDFEN